MVTGKVGGLKSGQLLMADILVGDCRDKMADRLLMYYR